MSLDTSCDKGFLGSVADKIFGACKTFDDFHLKYKNGTPEISQCLLNDFAKYYPTPTVGSAFQNFYDSAELHASFRKYWTLVAQTFQPYDTVLGYDLLNEPWPGNIWTDSQVLQPGYTDKTYVQPLYQSLNTVIRQHDPEKILFFEPTQVPDTMPLDGGIVYDVGFTETPGGVEYDELNMMTDKC